MKDDYKVLADYALNVTMCKGGRPVADGLGCPHCHSISPQVICHSLYKVGTWIRITEGDAKGNVYRIDEVVGLDSANIIFTVLNSDGIPIAFDSSCAVPVFDPSCTWEYNLSQYVRWDTEDASADVIWFIRTFKNKLQ